MKFGIYSKWLKRWGGLALCALLLLGSCAKEEVEISDSTEHAMLFSIEEIAMTKVEYGEQTNGGISATFEVGDQVGVYAFYNNFYYYYNQYEDFAESVILANHGMKVEKNDSELTLVYTPVVSWTFSTLYGTAPHTLDCVAYYPFEDGYNTDYAMMVHDSSGAATLEYYYAYTETNTDTDTEIVTETVKTRANIDFMTACYRNDEYAATTDKEDDPDGFREAMLSLESIPLSFTRQLASLNLQVTKPDGYGDKIVVNGITVYFDACTKFVQTIGYSDKIEWSEMTTGYSLTATTTCSAILAETGWDDVPEEDASNEGVANLLKDEDMLFFPPGSDILKIVFSITVGEGDSAYDTEYTWHPHIAPIVANTHYTLSLELDPERAN